jgi:hypothetical protein
MVQWLLILEVAAVIGLVCFIAATKISQLFDAPLGDWLAATLMAGAQSILVFSGIRIGPSVWQRGSWH